MTDNLIWIVIDEDTFPSTILGVYPTFEEAVSVSIDSGTRIVAWNIINNMEVNFRTDAKET